MFLESVVARLLMLVFEWDIRDVESESIIIDWKGHGWMGKRRGGEAGLRYMAQRNHAYAVLRVRRRVCIYGG